MTISIIGAGPGGLTCARILQLHGHAVTVYDADSSLGARNQGGTLDLHADGGQIALRDAGLIDEFFALARPDGQAKSFRGPDGALLVEHIPADDEDAAPEIDRGQLRELLAASVDPQTIRWGHKLKGATRLPDGRHRLEFENGTTADADLVIGADGAWSKVRALVSDARPEYTGITFVELRFEDADRRHPEVAELVGDGHLFSTSNGRAIILQRNSNGHIRGYAGMRSAADWYEESGIALTDTDAVRGHLLEVFAEWSSLFHRVLTTSDGEYTDRPLWALPAPLAWDHVEGVTLLGDAAHLMAPFGGDGVNLAMLDGAELARALVREASVDAAVSAYESVMVPRSGPIAVGANRALQEFFARGDFDLADLPDFDQEAQAYRANAAEYERARQQ